LPVTKPVYLIVPLLKNFQFAWRFLSLAIFIPPIIAGAAINLVKKRYSLFLVVIISVFSLFLNNNYWKANNYLLKDDSKYLEVQETSTNDSGESSPIWSIRRMEVFPKNPVEVIKGKAEILIVKRTSTEHLYKIDALVDSKILENTLYFPGWTILVDNQEITPEFQNPNYRGLMVFNLPQRQHEVKIYFQETRLRLVSDYLSVFGIILLLSLLVLEVFQGLRYRNIKHE
jgi:hypothetical protein